MNFLYMSYTILQCIGIFPSQNKSKWTLLVFRVNQLFILIVIGSVAILMSVQIVVATDLTILARTIDIWTMLLSSLYKWISMIVTHETFIKLKITLDQIQNQGSVAYGKSADLYTTNYLKPVRKFTLWYLFSGIIAAFFVIVSPLLTYSKSNRTEFDYYNDIKSYPLSCWIPFEINDSWKYWTIFTFQSLAAMVSMLIYLGIDSFMFGAIYAVGGQIHLLNSSLNNIHNYLEEGITILVYLFYIFVVDASSSKSAVAQYTKNQQTHYYSILRECVKHHILILDYIKDLRTLFSSLIIVDYLHGIISLSFALFQLTICDGIVETISVVCFIFVSVSHQFLNNFFGEYIIQKQVSVSTAAYHTLWWRSEKKIRQLLSLMILRSIKPTLITGFYMYKLSYRSFISFLKALYTYYMVLRNVNVDDHIIT